ncbi:MAG: Holliday junction branch migration protein RuvA [Gemmatimonadales bacterium]
MIAAVSGKLVSKSGDRVVIATASGLSYEVAVPLGVLERLPDVGLDVQLQTVPIVREDGWALYGFDGLDERVVFQRLLAVNGVGPRVALAIVSTLGGNRLIRVLEEGDVAALCTVPGVGKKTAERISLELKDKLGDVGAPPGPRAADIPSEQAVKALVNLGYTTVEADRAVRAVLSHNGSDQVTELIRGALQIMTRSK